MLSRRGGLIQSQAWELLGSNNELPRTYQDSDLGNKDLKRAATYKLEGPGMRIYTCKVAK